MKELKANVTVQLTDAEGKLFDAIIEGSPQALKIRDVFTAAAEEYVRMILGQKSFARNSDSNEYRLLLLTKHALNNTLPSEQTVRALFQVTPTRARSMIGNLVAKYQYELQETVIASLRQCLSDPEHQDDSDDLVIRTKNDAVVSLLMNKVRTLEGNHPQIRRTARVGEYTITPSVRTALLKALDE